ncbi:(4Fe-4S)-binding protein [Streptomyces sp. NBC_00876]|uniref:(4Fe-4S)-binding protein n=1 Tax=Streptomyces sp. NBC_00876 TaxID=2975853 RepID=UPI00386A6F46|nr:(4Fe-4S)-binding protein [Streptomyces sp. NBC_00876]
MTTEPPPHPAARSYEGDGITVEYDVHRCLHAAECVRGLPTVFDTGRRPWIRPGEAVADDIADVIHRCPSGALQYHRTDGGPDEEPEAPTRVSLHPDGVLHLRGDLEVDTPAGPREETRVMLCGCGRTRNTPYCDHSGNCADHG